MRWSSSFPTIVAFAQQKGGSAPSSSCPWLPDRCPFRRIYQPLLALRPAEWLASRPGPPPSRWQRLLRPSFLPRRSPHGEVGYHYAAVWTLAAAGLAPAGRVLLWAATSAPGAAAGPPPFVRAPAAQRSHPSRTPPRHSRRTASATCRTAWDSGRVPHTLPTPPAPPAGPASGSPPCLLRCAADIVVSP